MITKRTTIRKQLPKFSKVVQFLGIIIILITLYFSIQLVRNRVSISSQAGLGDPSITAALSFSAPTPTNPQTINHDFTTTIILNTADQAVVGVDTIITYDPTKLQVATIDPNPLSGFTSHPAKRFNNSMGEIYFSTNVGNGRSKTVTGSAVNLATITFHVLTDISITQLSFKFEQGNRNDSNVIPDYNDRRRRIIDILGTVTPLTITTTPVVSPIPSASPSPSLSPSPSPSLSPSPSPSPIANPVTLFLGVQGKDLATTTTPINTIITYKSIELGISNSTAAVLNNTDPINLSLISGGYVFLVKTPSYLARLYGTTDLPITISPASTSISLSDDPLLGGDFNNDGIINEIDYATDFLPAFASTNSNIDLDDSGQVNNLDFAIMRSNWGLIDDVI